MKIVREIIILLFLSYLLYGLVDSDAFIPGNWDRDALFNFLHLWFIFTSTYFIYQGLLERSVQNRRYGSSRREMIWLLSGICAVSMLWIVTMDLLYYNAYYGIQDLARESTFFDFDIPIAIVVLFIGSLYFYQKYVDTPIDESIREDSSDVIEVRKGTTRMFLDVDSVALLVVANKIVYAFTRDGKRYATDYVLNDLTSTLDSDRFFRLNRQSIIGRTSIGEIERAPFQKLIVRPREGINYPDGLVVSKYTAPAFRKWLTNSA